MLCGFNQTLHCKVKTELTLFTMKFNWWILEHVIIYNLEPF